MVVLEGLTSKQKKGSGPTLEASHSGDDLLQLATVAEEAHPSAGPLEAVATKDGPGPETDDIPDEIFHCAHYSVIASRADTSGHMASLQCLEPTRRAQQPQRAQ